MKGTMIVGVLLVVLGIAGLVGGRINYTTREKVLDLGPIQATAEKNHSIGIPDIAGVGALIAGLVLVVVSTRRRA